MTEDLLERALSDAMARRAHAAEPGSCRFAEVEARAERHRRSRTRGRGAIAVGAIALVVVGVSVVNGTWSDDSRLTVGPATDPSTTTMTAPALVGDQWAVLSSVEPTRADPAVTTVNGIQPSVPGTQDVEVTPYVYVGPRSERAVVYGLSGARWTTTVSWAELPSGGSATTTSITGSGFDPSRFDEIENTSERYDQVDPSFEPPAPDPSRASARPEDLLAAPGSSEVVLPVEHHGLFDWVVLPERCANVGDSCSKTAVGGDDTRVIVVDLYVPRELDLRSALADIRLRSSDQLGSALPGAVVGPDAPAAVWGAAPFFIRYLPVVRDDSVWPADVPTDYCPAFRQWKDIQIAHLGAFGTPGWIRWAQTLDMLAPPEVGDSWSVLATEQAAGHDTSATEPGVGALDVVVTDGDGRCPI